MRKAIIVDDEKMIRIGIQKAIAWEKLGIDEVSLASGSGEALEIIRAIKPHIMICDINMPEMTGLELISKVREIVPEMKIIILTGYDKFEYVRDSLRLHVDDFFLKPVDEEELEMVIKKLVDKLDEEEKIQKMKNIDSVSGQLQMEAFMRLHMARKVSREELQQFCLQYQLPDKQKMKIVIIVPPIKKIKPDEISLMEYEVKEICMGLIQRFEGEILFSDVDRNTVLVLKRDSESGKFSKRLRQISSVLEMEFSETSQIYTGETVDDWWLLPASYKDAKELQKESHSFELKKVKEIEANSRFKKWEEYVNLFRKELLLHADQISEAMAMYAHFVDTAKAWNVSSEILAGNCFDIVSGLYYKAFDKHEMGQKSPLEMFLISIKNAEKDDMFLLTRDFIERLLNQEGQMEEGIVSQAKAYIHEHLTENISVASIASELYVTPNYFSRLFKSVTGEGCNDYIVRKRIEKAQNMLVSTNMKAGKIAVIVGYNDANYFSLAFKKHTGYSPTQYRERMRMKEK